MSGPTAFEIEQPVRSLLEARRPGNVGGERFGGDTNFYEIGMELGFENAWAVFDTYLNTVTDKVVEDVQPKWLGKLGAVDVFIRSHAWEIVERTRLDA